MHNGKITVGSVCFIIDQKMNKVLMLLRAKEPMKGMLTGVGGKTDFNEDIYSSCIREIKEESGLDAERLVLKGVLKTLLDGDNSSWILFVYTCNDFSGELIACPEGVLQWVDLDKISELNMIGFISEITPFLFRENVFFEGTVLHNNTGMVLEKNIILR